MNKFIVVSIDGATGVSPLEAGADGAAAVAELRKAGTKAWLWGGAGDLAEMTGAELLLVRNGLEAAGAPLKNFENNEKNRESLFAMVTGGSIEIPASGDQATGTEAKQSKPGAANERKTKMTDATTKTAPKKAAKKAAKKAVKKAAAKKAATPRVKAPSHVSLPTNLVPPAGTTTGLYIRSLIMAGKSTAEILEKVAKHYPDSTAKGSDVSWNRQKLRNDGVKNVPDAPRPAKAEAAK